MTRPANGAERGAAYLDALGEQTVDDDDSSHVNQPSGTEAMLYGLAGEVGKAAAATTEANPYATCMGFLSFLSAMAGRDIYLPVGNTRHHARLFTLHVGRSSRGRKGDALSLVHRIRYAIDKREIERGTIGGSLLGQVHTGGLSSREGLVMFIHDGFKQGKEEVPPIDDKRLWVVENEFANVLQQAKRDGNTLSSALRDAHDGVSIKPATKTSRTWATDPHIATACAITPSELCEVMTARELSNGFANRFFIFWAERLILMPFPAPTGDDTLTKLVERTEKVLRFMRGKYPAESDTRRMSLSPDARTSYEAQYRGELNKGTGSVKLDAILERRAPMLLRLAMIFAMTDETLTIDDHHIRAAGAWVTYWVDSVRYIFKDLAEAEVNSERLAEASRKLHEYLIQKGEATKKEITNDCFQRRAPPGRLDTVIKSLLDSTPPKIMTITLCRRDGLPGRGKTIYKPISLSTGADIADIADIGVNAGFAPDSSSADIGGHSPKSANATDLSPQSPQSPQSQKPSKSRANKQSPQSPQSPQSQKPSKSRANKQSPLSPQSPHTPNKKKGAVKVEVINHEY